MKLTVGKKTALAWNKSARIGVILLIGVILTLNCSLPTSKKNKLNDFLDSLQIENLQELDGINQFIILSLNEGSLRTSDIPYLTKSIIVPKLSHYLNSLTAMEITDRDLQFIFNNVLKLTKTFEKRMMMNTAGNLGDRAGETLLNQLVLEEKESARDIVSSLRQVTKKWGLKRENIRNEHWASLLESGTWSETATIKDPLDFKCDPSSPIGEEALKIVEKKLSERNTASATKVVYCAFETACYAMKAPFHDNPKIRAVKQFARDDALKMAMILREVGLAARTLSCLAHIYSVEFNSHFSVFPQGIYFVLTTT